MAEACRRVLPYILYFPFPLYTKAFKPRGYRARALLIKVNVMSNKKDWCHVAPGGTFRKMHWRYHVTCVVFLPQTHNLHLILRNHQTNPGRGAFDKTPDGYSSKCQGHESLKVCDRSEPKRDYMWLNVTWDPGAENRRLWKNWWISNKVCSAVESTVPLLMSWFLTTVWWPRKIHIGEAGWRVPRGSSSRLCNFSVSLNLFEDKKLKKKNRFWQSLNLLLTGEVTPC